MLKACPPIPACLDRTPLQSEVGQPGYDPRFDVNGDETITMVDVQAFAAQWGWPAS